MTARQQRPVDERPDATIARWSGWPPPVALIFGFVALMLLANKLPSPWGPRLAVLAQVLFVGLLGLLGVRAWHSLSRRREGESDADYRLRTRNAAVGWSLVGLIALFVVVTMVRVGGTIAKRAI